MIMIVHCKYDIHHINPYYHVRLVSSTGQDLEKPLAALRPWRHQLPSYVPWMDPTPVNMKMPGAAMDVNSI